MDLSLWELSDGEDHHMFFESTYHVGDVGNFIDYTVYSPDVMEEDSLNEKSCVQVLKIMIDKADEEITKLEEDILMLQCQIAWNDEDWSKLCSVALREKIDCLDIAIEGLKKEITEGVRYLAVGIEQPEKLAQKLHDLLKPLLENYLLVKSKQRESSTIHMPAVLPADGLNEKKLESRTSEHKEKVEKKRCINQLKQNERENVLVKLKERKLNHSGQGKRMPESAPMKSRRISVKPEPPDPMPEALVSTTSLENAGSRKMDETNTTDKEVIIKSEIKLEHGNNETTSNLELRETKRKIAEIVKPADEMLDMEIEKQKIGASIKIRKARTCNRAIDKNVLLPTKPLVKIERETSIITEITEAVEDQGVEMNDSFRLVLFNHRTKHSSRARMNLGRKTQVPQRNGIGTLKINHAKPISSLKTEGRRPRKKCKAEEIHIKSSSGEKITENETQLAFSGIKIDGGPRADVSLISSKQNKSNSCFGYQIVEKKMKKPLKMEHDPFVGMAEEGDIRTKLVLHDPLVGMAEEAGIRTKLVLRIKDVDRLTLTDLRIMAKNQKLPRYYRLRKKELLERLGLEGPMQKANEMKGVPVSPANTI